ncbi:MAG TPA: hypothetical protein VF211_06325 [Burkholderiales bacterium]
MRETLFRSPILRKTVLKSAAILAVSLAVAAALQLAQPPAWLALGLAIGAFWLASLAAGRAKLVEFAPEVLGGDVILPPSRATGDVRMLLPLQFTNSGSADGVIEWVALRLTIDGDASRSVLLSPVAEVDMQRFLRAKRRLEPDNTLDPFIAFSLEGKRSVTKFVLFDLAEKGRTAPLHLAPGRYGFELFVKSSATRGPKLERTFEHSLDAKQIEEIRNDNAVYLISYQITLPAARREIGGGEWLPRAARFSN